MGEPQPPPPIQEPVPFLENHGKNIDKLSDTNYKIWAKDIEIRLKRLGIWHIISHPKPDNPSDAWTKADDYALSEIYFTVEPSQRSIFRDSTTARQCWKALETAHFSKSYIDKFKLSYDFGVMQMGSTETLQAWITRVKEADADLKAVGEIMGEEKLAYKLLMGLTDRYKAVSTAVFFFFFEVCTSMGYETVPFRPFKGLVLSRNNESNTTEINPVSPPPRS